MHPTDVSRPSTLLRPPAPADGAAMWALARDSGGLDLNSPYAYLLAGEHWRDTSVVAVDAHDDVVGFVVGYRPPPEPDSLFVWQVAVHPDERGQGLARRMVHDVLDRSRRRGVLGLLATVTPSNEPSRRLFRAVATDRGARYEERPLFAAALFPDGHEPEHRIVVSPV